MKDMSGKLSGGMENDVPFQMGQLAAAIRLAKDDAEALAILKRWHKENPVGKRIAAMGAPRPLRFKARAVKIEHLEHGWGVEILYNIKPTGARGVDFEEGVWSERGAKELVSRINWFGETG